MEIYAYGKHYNIDDDINLYDFLNEKRDRWEKDRDFEELKKENERLRRELKEKEFQLALNENQAVISPNGIIDISQKTMDIIIEEGKDLAFQLAIEGLRKAPLQKGINIKWNKG